MRAAEVVSVSSMCSFPDDKKFLRLRGHFFFGLVRFGSFSNTIYRNLALALSKLHINVDITVGFFVGQKNYRLNMHRLTKLIHRHTLLHPVPPSQDHLQIPHQTSCLTRNIDNPFHLIIQYLRQRLRMYPIPRRIQHDHIRLLLNLIQHLKDIPRNKPAIIQPIPGSILPGSLHSLLNNLYPNHLFRHRSQHLPNRPRPAEQIKDRHILNIPDILPHRLIKHLSPSGIRLEERKRGDLEFHPKYLLIKIIFPIENPRLITLHHIGKRIIQNMKNPHNLPFQFQL